MEKFNERLNVRFVLPDKVTVRQQLAYFSNTSLARGSEMYERWWLGAQALITDWQCERFEMDVDLGSITDPKITEIVLWTSLEVRKYMDALEEVPKN